MTAKLIEETNEMKRLLLLRRGPILAIAWIAASLALAQQPLVIKPLAEKKVNELPPGELFWRIENFSSVEQANAAAGPWSLVTEAAGKVWLFTLGPAGGSSGKGTKVTEVGP